MVDEATRKLIFPTPDPFGWSKKGSGLTRFVGQARFPSRILFFSEGKRFWPLTNFIVVLLTEVQEDLKKLKNFSCKEQKMDWEASGAKRHHRPPLRSERAFRNTRFTFCVLRYHMVMSFDFCYVWKNKSCTHTHMTRFRVHIPGENWYSLRFPNSRDHAATPFWTSAGSSGSEEEKKKSKKRKHSNSGLVENVRNPKTETIRAKWG
jgi:hypothetical protein